MGKWARGVLIGVIALLGIIAAAVAQQGFWATAGVVIAVVAVWIIFRLIGQAFDQPGEHTAIVPVPGSPGGRLWAGAFSALLGLVALAVASAAHGAAGTLALFVTLLAWLYVFRLIGASFDAAEAKH